MVEYAIGCMPMCRECGLCIYMYVCICYTLSVLYVSYVKSFKTCKNTIDQSYTSLGATYTYIYHVKCVLNQQKHMDRIQTVHHAHARQGEEPLMFGHARDQGRDGC